MKNKNKIYIVKVRTNKSNNQRIITIPKEAEDVGEYAEISNHEI